MNVETVPLTSLTPDPLNARKHNRRNIDAIKASLSKFGQRKPIVVTNDGTVIAGNGTLEAATSLGWKEISIARAPEEWDENTVRAYALADNQTGALAEWDEKILNTALEDLTSEGWDIAELGFDELIEPEEPLNGDLDDVPEAPAIPKTQLGDIYQLGEHRVICGDSTDVRTFGLLMQGEKADLVLTDPPYGVSYVGKTADSLTIENDKLDNKELSLFLGEAFRSTMEYSRDGSCWFVFSPPGPLLLTFGQQLLDLGIWRQTLIWVKNSLVMGHSDYHYRHETVFYGWKPGAAHHEPIDRKQTSILEFDRPTANKEHPTMKPVDLLSYAINQSSGKGDLVLDPFGGSGSTLLAAESLGRKARLIELDPKYVDVIVRRWETVTGKTAVLL